MVHSWLGSHLTPAHKLVAFVDSLEARVMLEVLVTLEALVISVALVIMEALVVLLEDCPRAGTGRPMDNAMRCDDTSRSANIMARGSKDIESDLCLLDILAAPPRQSTAIVLSANKKNGVISTLSRFSYSFSLASTITFLRPPCMVHVYSCNAQVFRNWHAANSTQCPASSENITLKLKPWVWK